MTKIQYTYNEIIKIFRSSLSGIYEPREVENLAMIALEEVTSQERHQVLTKKEQKLPALQTSQLIKILEELKTGKPIQQITGNTSFYGLQLKVNANVLIPRPETEELVDIIIKENKNHGKKLAIIDIGTGSGCIAIALSKFLDNALVVGIDNSAKALETAKYNAKKNQQEIAFFEMDITNHQQYKTLDQKFDLVVSNPPYIRENEKRFMHKNVLNFEPAQALFVNDQEPLHFYKYIIDFCATYLYPGGKLYLEINEAMGELLTTALKENGMFKKIIVIQDMNGKNRFVKCELILPDS